MSFDLGKYHIARRFVDAFLLCSGLLVVVLAVSSLRWQIPPHAVILNYITQLITRHDLMPYRDIFDHNLPGAYFFHWLLVKVVGFSRLGFRFFDLFWLGALLITTYLVMKDFSRRIACAAAIFVGLIYLAKGAEWSLAAEVVILLPLALAVLVSETTRISEEKWRNFIIGFLVGAAAVLKPTAFLILAAFIPAYQSNNSETKLPAIWLRVGWLVLGFIILPMICILWIWLNGAFNGFWYVFTKYLPLYRELNGDLVLQGGADKILYNFDRLYSLFPISILFGPAALGAYLFLIKDEPRTSRVHLFLALLFLCVIMTVIQGKYWSSHWFGALYFTVLLLSLCFSEENNQRRFVLGLTIFVLVLYLYPLKHTLLSPQSFSFDQGEEIAGFLKTNSRPFDKVQAVGWQGPAIRGMYKAKSQPATPFIYTLMFFHHVKNPFIQNIQSDFLNRLQKTPPRYIVQGYGEPLPRGGDTSQNFKALESFIRANYQPAKLGNTYMIWVKNK